MTTPPLFFTDIDECSSSSGIVHGCQAKCNNNIGSYSCSCDKGYYLTSNGKDCSGKKIGYLNVDILCVQSGSIKVNGFTRTKKSDDYKLGD